MSLLKETASIAEYPRCVMLMETASIAEYLRCVMLMETASIAEYRRCVMYPWCVMLKAASIAPKEPSLTYTVCLVEGSTCNS